MGGVRALINWSLSASRTVGYFVDRSLNFRVDYKCFATLVTLGSRWEIMPTDLRRWTRGCFLSYETILVSVIVLSKRLWTT
jgi:hypothetical protein